jgi:biotin carboxyl carrier protein
VVYRAASRAETWLALDDRMERQLDLLAGSGEKGDSGGDARVRAPMHGLLRAIHVSEGDRVKRGERLLVVEAMKMQHEVQAGIDGVIYSISREAGGQVAAGEVILEIEPVEATEGTDSGAGSEKA